MFRGSPKKWARLLEESSLVRHYLWKYRRWIGIGLCALIVVDVIDVLPPIFLKEVVDITVDHRPAHQLLLVAIGYLGVSLVQACCRYFWRMYLIRSSVFAGRDLRKKYTHHLFGLSVSFFDRCRMGDLMSLATNDVEAVRTAIGTGMLVLADALIYLLTVPVVMYFLSPRLTFWACLPLPIVPWIVMRNEREVHERFMKVQDCFGRISGLTQESLNGIRVVKAFAREDTQIQRMKRLGEEFIHLNLRLARIQTSVGPTLDFIMSLGMIMLIFIGGKSVISTGADAISLGTFVAFQKYIQKMVWPMAALGMATNYFQRAISSSQRLQSIFSISTDVPQSQNPKLPVRNLGQVEFRNLSFQYPGTHKEVLKDICFKIEPGERVALVGAVGSGKTSLLALLPRLYPIQKGMLLIDGVDINEWPIEELRRCVGYVSQEVFLFSETVFENVGFGLHEWAKTWNLKTSIEQATQASSVHDEIMNFSAHYRTRLGERGVNLSGGQKQRLTIARALAKEPAILVLDDALSSVDVQTEESILKGLKCRSGRNTEILSSHRISTIREADRIIVLKAGRIIQSGKHQQLLTERGSEYWKFYEQQRLREDLENYQYELN